MNRLRIGDYRLLKRIESRGIQAGVRNANLLLPQSDPASEFGSIGRWKMQVFGRLTLGGAEAAAIRRPTSPLHHLSSKFKFCLGTDAVLD